MSIPEIKNTEFEVFDNLPNLKSPSPCADNPTDDFSVYIVLHGGPIFEGTDKEIVDFYVKMAIWCRHSWLLHTDAIDHNASVKLYIEDSLIDRYRSMLAENHIDLKKDVTTFTVPKTPKKYRPQSNQDRWSYHGKYTLPFSDPQIWNTEHVFFCNADHAWYRPQGVDRLPFFSRVKESQKYGIFCHRFRNDKPNNILEIIEASITKSGYTKSEVEDHLEVDLEDLFTCLYDERLGNSVSPTILGFSPSFINDFFRSFRKYSFLLSRMIGHPDPIPIFLRDEGMPSHDLRDITDLDLFTCNTNHIEDLSDIDDMYWARLKITKDRSFVEMRDMWHEILNVERYGE